MLAIMTDSTSDLRAEQLEALKVRRVPLYVHFREKVYRDWIEIDPAAIIAGVDAGADLPTTSQPSPEDFTQAYQEAVAAGATEILVVTISSVLSGTYQSATLAAKTAPVPVSVVDSLGASAGIAVLVQQAVRMRDAGADRETIAATLEGMRAHMLVLFSVGTLDYLLKGGRLSRTSAVIGGLLNIRPILALEGGKIVPVGKVRGTKKAIAEIVERLKAHAQAHPGELVLDFLYAQDRAAVEHLRQAVRDAGVKFTEGSIYEIGAVLTSHVGPGTFAAYAHVKPD